MPNKQKAKAEKEDDGSIIITKNQKPEYEYEDIIDGQKVVVKRYKSQERPDILEAVPKASR